MEQVEQVEHLEPPVTIAPMTEARPLLRTWWQLVDMRIGIIPLPLFPLIVALMAGFVWLGKLPPDLTMMIPLLGNHPATDTAGIVRRRWRFPRVSPASARAGVHPAV